MVWTSFWDMHSGGDCKEPPFEMIYIEAPEKEAKVIFYNRFGHNPERITCTCCGEDYSIEEGKSLEQLSGYHRNCEYKGKEYIEAPNKYSDSFQTLSEYVKNQDVLVIYESQINPEERLGTVPQEGYVWV